MIYNHLRQTEANYGPIDTDFVINKVYAEACCNNDLYFIS